MPLLELLELLELLLLLLLELLLLELLFLRSSSTRDSEKATAKKSAPTLLPVRSSNCTVDCFTSPQAASMGARSSEPCASVLPCSTTPTSARSGPGAAAPAHRRRSSPAPPINSLSGAAAPLPCPLGSRSTCRTGPAAAATTAAPPSSRSTTIRNILLFQNSLSSFTINAQLAKLPNNNRHALSLLRSLTTLLPAYLCASLCRQALHGKETTIVARCARQCARSSLARPSSPAC